MSAARPARNVLTRCLRQGGTSRIAPATTAATSSSRSFQTSAARLKRKPRFKNIKAEDMGLTKSTKKMEDFARKVFPDYTEKEKAVLRKRYTPEQYEALQAGEAAIDTRDLTIQGRLRDDPYRLDYIEDFATVQPIIDQKPEKPVTPKEFKFKSQKEWVDDFIVKLADKAEVRLKDTVGKAVARALRNVKGTDPDMIDFTEEELKDLEENPELRRKYIVDNEAEVDPIVKGTIEETKNNPGKQSENPAWWEKIDDAFYQELQKEFDAKKNPLEGSKIEEWKEFEGPSNNTALAPELGKVPGVEGLYNEVVDPEDEGLDDAGNFDGVKRITGFSVRDIQSIMTKTIVVRRVANQTRLGKIVSNSVIVVAGNGDGRLGLGEAKSTEHEIAQLTATLLAIRNTRPIRRYENRTIYGQIDKKISGTVVQLRSRPPGFGLRVSHRIFEMARLAGIHDLAAKIPRSKNPMNTVKATYEALLNQPDPEEIAIGRGKKMIDVRKVYYGGSVY